jgi:hypothetical protein
MGCGGPKNTGTWEYLRPQQKSTRIGEEERVEMLWMVPILHGCTTFLRICRRLEDLGSAAVLSSGGVLLGAGLETGGSDEVS